MICVSTRIRGDRQVGLGLNFGVIKVIVFRFKGLHSHLKHLQFQILKVNDTPFEDIDHAQVGFGFETVV